MKKGKNIPKIPVQKGIVFVQGSWYQMGKQYGAYAKDAVRIKCAVGNAGYADRVRQDPAAEQRLMQSLGVIEQRAPQIRELWQGIARGASRPFSEVAAAYIDFRTTDMHCSNISAWGRATGDREVRCAMNCDERELVNYYAPTVVACPKGGFPFLSASAFTCNCVMNNQGLVLMASCGQNALEEDVEAGLPNCISLMLCAAECKTAGEARDKILNEKLGPGGGENIHIADLNGTACVIEHTAARDRVRRPGDHGERDFLLAANHFLTEEMEQSNFSGREKEAWMNSYFRYRTERHMLEEYHGRITLDVLNRILGCRSFWGEDFETLERRGWKLPEEIRKGWNSIEGIRDRKLVYRMGKFSPEIQTPVQKCVFSALLYPGRREFYLVSGCRNTEMSMNPRATGIFTKLRLEASVRDIVESIREEAEKRLFDSAVSREKDREKDRDREREAAEAGRKAKSAYAEGIYWKSKAVCEKKKKKRLRWWSYAASAFLKTQEYSYLTLREVSYDESEEISIPGL